jgi:hypothetical protein
VLRIRCACGREAIVNEQAPNPQTACTGCGAPLSFADAVFEAPAPAKRSNTRVIGLIIGGVVLVGGCGLVAVLMSVSMTGLRSARAEANERNAAASLKSVVTAEEIFRANDMDRNGVADYWTANVAGLYCLTDTQAGNAIAALNDIAVASADIDAENDAAVTYRGDGVAYDLGLLLNAGAGLPKTGYGYQALIHDGAGRPYARDTDRSGAAVHHESAFGAAAIPVAWNEGATHCFIVNEGGVVYRRDFDLRTAPVKFGTPLSTFDGTTRLDWPAPPYLSVWSKVE